MFPINIYTDNLFVSHRRHKKYNKKILFLDIDVFFRIRKRMVRRTITILTKERALIDMKDLQNRFIIESWSDEEQKIEKQYQLCGFKNLTEFSKNKKNLYKYLYCDVDDEDFEEDLLMKAPKDENEVRPFSVDIIVPEKDITIDLIKKTVQEYLEKCFNLKSVIKDINFISLLNEEDLDEHWEMICKETDRMDQLLKQGKTPKIILTNNAAKNMFGEDVREVILEDRRITVKFEDGEEITEVSPSFKFIKKRKKKHKN